MKAKINNLYKNFFEEMGVNPVTGEFKNGLKFETFPHIGSKYEDSQLKVLFVGLDIGGEKEKIGKIQSIEERSELELTETFFNPHIAGTYTSSLYFLKDKYKWNAIWDKVSKYLTSTQATKTKQHQDGENPLSYIALTNFYKFVDKGREYRSGDKNRRFNDQQKEIDLFISEIEILNPEIIIFQGYDPAPKILDKIRKPNRKIFKAPHPSNRKKDGRQPLSYVNSFIPL